MKRKKKHKEPIRQAIFISFLFIAVFFFISFVTYENPEMNVSKQQPKISEGVSQYRPLVEKYAAMYDVSNYTDVLLAMMMQESGGRGSDPMQASESYCGEVGCITEPELSIKQGVYYFSSVLEEADGDLELAVQSYNFGPGFIDYVEERSGTYSQEAAIDFSREMYEKASNKSIYTCLRKEAEKYDACYGDIYYVQAVMEYRDTIAMK